MSDREEDAQVVGWIRKGFGDADHGWGEGAQVAARRMAAFPTALADVFGCQIASGASLPMQNDQWQMQNGRGAAGGRRTSALYLYRRCRAFCAQNEPVGGRIRGNALEIGDWRLRTWDTGLGWGEMGIGGGGI